MALKKKPQQEEKIPFMYYLAARIVRLMIKDIDDMKVRERAITRRYSRVYTKSFWGTKVTLIERDKPLTDAELKALGY